MSDSLGPHELQHARLPCPSLSPTESAMLSNHFILCRHLLLLPSIFPSIRAFSSESALCIRWPRFWSFSFSISPSNKYSGWISFRMNLGLDLRFDLLAVQWTLLKSFLHIRVQKHQVFSAQPFLWSQLSHLYMTTGKSRVLTIQAYASKVISLLFNTLPRFVVNFLSKSKCLLISRLQSLSAVRHKKIKSVTASTFSPSICHKVMGPNVMLGFQMLRVKPAF